MHIKNIFLAIFVLFMLFVMSGCISNDYDDTSLRSFLRDGPSRHTTTPLSQPNMFAPEAGTSRVVFALIEAKDRNLPLEYALHPFDLMQLINPLVGTNKNEGEVFKWKNPQIKEIIEMRIGEMHLDGKNGNFGRHKQIHIWAHLLGGRKNYGVFTLYEDSNGWWWVATKDHIEVFDR